MTHCTWLTVLDSRPTSLRPNACKIRGGGRVMEESPSEVTRWVTTTHTLIKTARTYPYTDRTARPAAPPKKKLPLDILTYSYMCTIAITIGL